MLQGNEKTTPETGRMRRWILGKAMKINRRSGELKGSNRSNSIKSKVKP